MLHLKKIHSASRRMYSASWHVCDQNGNPLGLHLARFEYRGANLPPGSYQRGWMVVAAFSHDSSPLSRQAARSLREQRFHTRREALQATELALNLAAVRQKEV